jgi:hypothetical protein
MLIDRLEPVLLLVVAACLSLGFVAVVAGA